MSKSAKLMIGLASAALVIILAWWQSQNAREEAQQLASGVGTGTQEGAGGASQDTAANGDAATSGGSDAAQTGSAGSGDQQTAALTQPETEPEPETEAKTAQPPEPIVPEIDVVRVSAFGQAVIAGRASPGQMIQIVLDGEVLAELTADQTGQFATVLDIPNASEPQELILRTIIDGEVAEEASIRAEPDATAIAAAEEARKAAEDAATDEAAAKAEADKATAEEEAAKAATEEAARAAEEAQRAAEEAAADAEAKAEAEEAERLAAEEAARKAEEEAARLAAEETARKAEEEAARLAAEAQRKVEEQAARRAAEKAEAARLAAEAAADPAAGSAEPNVVASVPVFILPRPDANSTPVLVKPGAEDITLLQPAQAEPAANITLDRLTYSDAGDLVAAGRGTPGSAVRVYANAEFVQQVICNAEGEWQVSIATDVAAETQLLRFDSVDAAGNVVGRLETPFDYSPQSVAQELQQREIVVQRGDYLWKFAEQHYGEGWRYSVIFSANSDLIRDPDLIYPGQIFKVPELVQTQ